MNYYQHHIGDFIRDTARLSDSQCMAYMRMLWIYYENESPLEDDADAIAFKIGANAGDVTQILKHFFFLHDDGLWHQARCDKEILAFREKSVKAKKSADARWNNANAMRTHNDRNANEPLSDANQEPITNNQKPIKNKKHTSDDLAIAEFIFEGVLRLNPDHKKPSLETWAESVRLMRERDTRSVDEIRNLFTWANQHRFWAKNVLSPDKLREKFDQLTIQRNQEAANANNQPANFQSRADRQQAVTRATVDYDAATNF